MSEVDCVLCSKRPLTDSDLVCDECREIARLRAANAALVEDASILVSIYEGGTIGDAANTVSRIKRRLAQAKEGGGDE